MEWPCQTIDGWTRFHHLVANLLSLGTPFEIPYIFRGQANTAWPLVPSLVRALGDGTRPATALWIEDLLRQEFMSQAHLHIPPGVFTHTLADADWWQLMQHHGAPTRLLDWTQSPYVAL